MLITRSNDSPYSQLMENIVSHIGLETGSSPDVVAKVVLKVVTSENPDLRYLAGNDIETVIEAKRNMSNEEFYKMMKQRWRV